MSFGDNDGDSVERPRVWEYIIDGFVDLWQFNMGDMFVLPFGNSISVHDDSLRANFVRLFPFLQPLFHYCLQIPNNFHPSFLSADARWLLYAICLIIRDNRSDTWCSPAASYAGMCDVNCNDHRVILPEVPIAALLAVVLQHVVNTPKFEVDFEYVCKVVWRS